MKCPSMSKNLPPTHDSVDLVKFFRCSGKSSHLDSNSLREANIWLSVFSSPPELHGSDTALVPGRPDVEFTWCSQHIAGNLLSQNYEKLPFFALFSKYSE